MPFVKCLGTHLTERWARNQMALQIELVVDGIVGGQKPLHRARRLEPAHSAFSSARRLMRNFGPIVQSTTRDMKVFQAKFSKRCGI